MKNLLAKLKSFFVADKVEHGNQKLITSNAVYTALEVYENLLKEI